MEPISASCPYCGEEVELSVDPVGMSQETYVEDCQVCCRPCVVHLTRGEEGVDVQLARDDE